MSAADSIGAAAESTMPAEGKGEVAEPTGSENLRAEAVAFIKEMEAEGEAEESNQEPAEQAKASPESDKDDKSAAPEEKSDDAADAKADESDEDEDAEAEAGADEQPAEKRETGYQKKKRQLEEARKELEDHRQKVARFEERESEWQHVAETLKQRLDEQTARERQLEERLREFGAGPDPAERRVAELERKLREQEQALALRERQAEQRRKQIEEQERASQSRALRETCESLGERFGLDPKEIAVKAAGYARAAKLAGKRPPSLEEVADEMATIRDYRAGQTADRQAQASGNAPRPVRGSSPSAVAPQFEPTSSGAVAYLKSIGRL